MKKTTYWVTEHLIFKASGFHQGFSLCYIHQRNESIACSACLRDGKLRHRINCLAWGLVGILWEGKIHLWGLYCLLFLILHLCTWEPLPRFLTNLPPLKTLPTFTTQVHLTACHMQRVRGRKMEVACLKSEKNEAKSGRTGWSPNPLFKLPKPTALCHGSCSLLTLFLVIIK